MGTKLAYCGLDCDQCPAKIAKQTDDDALRDKTAAEWGKMFNAEIPPETINCDGCKTEFGTQFFHCSQCGVRECASGKGFETCAECDDYACDKVSFIVDNVKEAKAALAAIRSGKA